MGKPIYILAGQSNASAIAKTMRQTLEDKHGVNGFVLVEAFYPGSPLTFKRSKQDWAEANELRKVLHDNTLAALHENPSGRIAGMIWVQGEADTHKIARADEYADRLKDLFQEFSQDLATSAKGRDTGIDSAKFIISSLSTHAPEAPERTKWSEIIKAQKEVAADSNDVSLVNPDAVAIKNAISGDDMFKDSLHYSDNFQAYLVDALIRSVWDDGGSSNRTELRGTAGDDILRGDAGPNRMLGGKGNDTYYLNHTGDRIVELDGEGKDTVIASISVSLGDHSQFLETLVLVGTDNINAVGNALWNTIAGNSGNNFLDGARGNDRLFGGGGDDVFRDDQGSNVLAGGWGHDTYYINHSGNRIVEHKGRGIDHVVSSIDLSLADYGRYIENLTLTGNSNIDGAGNSANNIIVGNSGNNALSGGGGHDTLIGGKGHDLLMGGDGKDTFVFNTGDMVRFKGRNHDEMDRILDFEIGKDTIRFDNSPVKDMSDLRMWADPANDQFVIMVRATGDRIVLDGLYDWSEVHDADNFAFL